ncbi:MAG: VaFE repeat-containing surface-anchored protein [Lachnospiraceae bacterium]
MFYISFLLPVLLFLNNKKLQRILASLIICVIVVCQFSNVKAAIYENDEDAAKSLPYIYTFDNCNIYDEASRSHIIDNPFLVKAIYYAYGSMGFCNNYSIFEEFYFNHKCTTEENKLLLTNNLLTNIYLDSYNEQVTDYIHILDTLPEPDTDFTALYLYDANDKLIGFSYEMNSTIENQNLYNNNNGALILSEEEDTDILGTSNGVYYNGHPAIQSFTHINGAEYGLPDTSIPANWFNASTDNQIEIAKVKFSYTYVGNSSATGVTFGGANAVVTSIVNGAYATNSLIGKQISLFHCMTGSSDSAPYDKNDSDTDSSLYIAKNSDNVCYMHFYVRSVDTTNHKVYIEIRTDYIDADYNRHNTSVQAVAGGVWYSYTSDSYITMQKSGIANYIQEQIILNDINLQNFSLSGIQYGIYKTSNKNTPIATITFDDTGCPNPQIIKLDANTDYYYHEICGNQYYKGDNGYYLFNSGEYKINSIDSAQKINVTDSIKPYSLYFKKTSGIDSVSKDNSMYNLEGAYYSLFNKDNNPANFIVGYEAGNGDNNYLVPILLNTENHPFITDKDGNLTVSFEYSGNAANITDYYKHVVQQNNTYTLTFTEDSPLQLFYGEYYMKEVSSPKGFVIDTMCMNNGHKITLDNPDITYRLVCYDNPLYHHLTLRINKTDMEDDSNISKGNGSLENAVFEFRYYDGLYNKEQIESLKPTKTWYFSTNEDGIIDFQTGKLSSKHQSDSFYTYNNKRVLPLGTVTIREVAPPKGYLNVNDKNAPGKIIINDKVYPDNEEILIQIKSNTSKTATDIYINNNINTDPELKINVSDNIIRGDLSFIKTNYKTGRPMKNIAFLITSNTTGEQHIIVTDDNGYATTRSNSTMCIHGETITMLHTKNTNKNDIYIDDLHNPDIVNNSITSSGIWFYGTNNPSNWNPDTIDDQAGALPYDSYSISEIFSCGNETTQLVIDDDYVFDIKENGESITLAISDMPTPVISTSSYDSIFKDHYSLPGKDTTIIDSISYNYLRYNKDYTIKGILVARKDCKTKDGHVYHAGEPIMDGTGEYVRNNVSFKTSSNDNSVYYANASGKVNLIYNFDSSNLQGINGVWQTFLCEGIDQSLIEVENGKINKEKSNVLSYEILNNKQFIEDVDLSNENEFVSFMSIETDAWTSDYTINVDKVSAKTVITDTIYLSNLIENNEYKIKSTLVDGDTGEIINGIDGNPCTKITNNIVYKEDPATNSMKIDINLPAFDSSTYLGKHVVVYEDLLWNNKVYVKDDDLYNQRQSVYFPCIIKTYAHNADGSKTIPIKDTIHIVDTVTYKGLAPNHEYTVRGTLHYKDTQGKEQTLYNIYNEPVEAITTFTPDTSDGEINVYFDIKTDEIKTNENVVLPNEIVVFEELRYNNLLIYTHADINDTDQTVLLPTLETSLVNSLSNYQFVDSYNKELSITDHVKYTNLNVGDTYTIVGKLMNKKTNKPLVENGREVTGTKTFTAQESSGTVDVNFTFNGDLMSDLFCKDQKEVNAQIVAYEYLYSEFDHDQAIIDNTLENYTDIYKDVSLWSVHADINNTAQTITKVEGTTHLRNANNSEQYLTRNNTILLEDTIDYQNILPGREYIATGTLYNGTTGEAIKDKNNNIVTSAVKFVAKEPDGNVKVKFNVNYNDIPNMNDIDCITAFEELKDLSTNQIIFEHKDIKDKNQTVYFPDIKTEALCMATNSHSGTLKKETTIRDTIYYDNLIAGKEYAIKGKLYDKSSNKPLLYNDKEIISEVTFIPEKSKGTVGVDFNFDSTYLSNKDIVCFEEIYINDNLIGSHCDINDDNQTISFPPEDNPPKKTGDMHIINRIISLMIFSVFSFVIIYAYKRRFKSDLIRRRFHEKNRK